MAKQTRQDILIRVKDEASRQFKEFTRLNKLAAKSIRDTTLPAEKYRAQIRDLKGALDQASLSQEQFNRAVRKARQDFAAAERRRRGGQPTPAGTTTPTPAVAVGGFTEGVAKVLASASAIEGSFRTTAAILNLMAGDTKNFVANLERLPVIGTAINAWMEIFRASWKIAAGEAGRTLEAMKEQARAAEAMLPILRQLKDRNEDLADAIVIESLSGIQRQAAEIEAQLKKTFRGIDAEEVAALAKAASDADKRAVKSYFEERRESEIRLSEIRLERIRAEAIERDRQERRLAAERAAQEERRILERDARFRQIQRNRELREQLAQIGATAGQATPLSPVTAIGVSANFRGRAATFAQSEQARVAIDNARRQARNDAIRNDLLKKIELNTSGVSQTLQALGMLGGGIRL